MPLINVPTKRITDWETFFDVFEELGFRDCRNMAAWADCLLWAEKDDGTRSFVVPPGDVLTLVIDDARASRIDAQRFTRRSWKVPHG